MSSYQDDTDPLGLYEEQGRERLKARQEDQAYFEALRTLVQTPEGELVLCRWLDKLGAFSPAWRRDSSIHQATALKDFAGDLLDDLAIAAPKAHDAIQRAMRIRRRLGENFRMEEKR